MDFTGLVNLKFNKVFDKAFLYTFVDKIVGFVLFEQFYTKDDELISNRCVQQWLQGLFP